MLSDDRPTDPAWLPIFSNKEHFMGNAFGMIPGLEPDECSMSLPWLCHYGNGELRIFKEGYTACCGAAL